MANRRMERVNQLILEEVANVIQKDLEDPHVGFTTVVSVDTASDFSQSVIHISVLDSAEKQETSVNALNRAANFIRNEIAPKIKTRLLPRLIFKLDHTAETAIRITQLLNEKK